MNSMFNKNRIVLLFLFFIVILVFKLYKVPISYCDFLLYPTVRPNNDVVEIKRDVCLGNLAWKTNNWKYCNKHRDKDHCVGWMAIKTGDLQLCEMRDKKTGYFWIENKLKDTDKNNSWLYDCYRATANWRNDPNICEKIPYKSSDLINSCKETALNWGNHYSQYKSSPI